MCITTPNQTPIHIRSYSSPAIDNMISQVSSNGIQKCGLSAMRKINDDLGYKQGVSISVSGFSIVFKCMHIHQLASTPFLSAKIAQNRRKEGTSDFSCPSVYQCSSECTAAGGEGEMEIECMCEMGNDADCARDICQW